MMGGALVPATSHHQLLVFPLRKEIKNDNKQINNTCRRTDKLHQTAVFELAS